MMPPFIISPSENYPQQMENMALQEVQDDSPPNFMDDTMVAAAAAAAVAAEEAKNMVLPPSNSQKKRKENKSWTEYEHKLFLVGIEKYGKGNWKNISILAVRSKNPSQVASHAQKYFLRQQIKKKKRKSIHDITLDESEYIFFSNIIDSNLTPSWSNQNQNHGITFEESGEALVHQQTWPTTNMHDQDFNTNIENHGPTMMGFVNPSITNHQSSNFSPQVHGNIYPEHEIATEEPYHHVLFPNHNGHEASAPTTSLNQDLSEEDHGRRMMGVSSVNPSITTNHQNLDFFSEDWSQSFQNQIHQTYRQIMLQVMLQAESTLLSLPNHNGHQASALTTSLNQDQHVDHGTRMMGGLAMNPSITTNLQSSVFPSQNWNQPSQSQIYQTYQMLQADQNQHCSRSP